MSRCGERRGEGQKAGKARGTSRGGRKRGGSQIFLHLKPDLPDEFY